MGTGTRIQLCGRLAVELDGTPIEGALPGRQGRLLFAYLVLNRDRPVRRDELVEAVWADDPGASDTLLSPPLSRLRKALGPGRLEGRTELQLSLPADAFVDWEAARDGVATARAAIDRRDWRAGWTPAQDALAIADRGLLPGLEATWIDERRRELADLRVEALEAIALIGPHLGRAESAQAEQAARAAVDAAPFRESAHAALMEALRARGNVAEALRAFEDVRVLLRDELGATPGPALMALHERLLRSDSDPADAPATAAAAPLAPPVPGELPDRLAEAADEGALVGRAAPLERLRAELRAAAGGTPGLVLVAGEGGIGKTSLVAALAREAPGFTVLYGRCDEEQLFPFGPWIELLGGYVERVADAELPAVLGADGPDLARLLPELRDRVPDLPRPVEGDPETDRRRLFAGVVAITRRLARSSPLLLVIDDLHWADRSSLLLLRALTRAPQLGAVLLLGTYRDNELAPRHPLLETLADLERERSLTRLHLEGLAEDEVAELLDGSPEAASIRAETGGNPFFVKQLARHLAEGGVPVERPSGVRFGIPAGLRDVIAGRVARLPEHAETVLGTASLIGRDFQLELLEDVVDVDEGPLLDVLDAAVQAALLIEARGRPGEYSFAHSLLRTTLEDRLTETRRARIHRRIGEAIAVRYADRIDPWLTPLARHFIAAGPDAIGRAVEYAVLAADHAAERLAFEDAAELTTTALAALERSGRADDGLKAKLLLEHSKSVWRLGDFVQARQLAAASAAAARDAGDPITFAEAAFDHAGGAWEWFGVEYDVTIALLEEALELLPEADLPLRARVLAQLAEMLYFAPGAEERIEPLAAEAVAMARRDGDVLAMADALDATNYAHWRPGAAEQRLAAAEELVAVTAAGERNHYEADGQTWLAATYVELGRRAEADAAIDRHAAIADELRHPELQIRAAAHRALRATLSGDLVAGEAAAADLLEHGARSTALDVAQFRAFALVALLGPEGRLAELLPEIERLIDAAARMPAWRAARVWALAQSGREDEARAAARELMPADFAIFPADVGRVPALVMLAHAAHELADAELAAALEPLLKPLADTWCVLGPGAATLGPVAYAAGLTAAGAGRDDAAVAHLEQALDLADEMDAPPHAERARRALAELRDVERAAS